MKILILGGTGFIGRNLTEKLLTNHIPVRLFSRTSPLEQHKNYGKLLEWHRGDFSNSTELSNAMEGCDVIYHLIGTTTPQTSNKFPIMDISENLLASVRMLETARCNSIQKIIFVSSGGTVYGIPEQNMIKETHPTNPICSYGIVKLAIEKYLNLFHINGGPDYTIFRLGNPYGYYQSPEACQGVIPVFMKKAMEQNSIQIWGDGTTVRDYVFIDDVIEAMLLALDYEGNQKIFNLGSGEGTSINQLLESIEMVLGQQTKKTYLKTRKCDVPTNILNIKLIQKHLRWTPKTSLKSGLSKLARYLEKTAHD